MRKRQLDLWNTGIRTRLDNKAEGAILIVSQRLDQDDLVGHVSMGEGA